MPEKITAYKTEDGHVFDRIADAERHEKTNKLVGLLTPHFTRTDVEKLMQLHDEYRIGEILCGSTFASEPEVHK